MTIIVEDGSGVAGANSYVSLQDLIEYAASRGETLPDDETAQTALLFQGVDYLQYTFGWKGEKTYPDAELEWPRTGIKGIAPDSIPRVVQVAQMKLAILAYTEDLFPTSSASTTREKVDVIEVEYSDTGTTGRFSSPTINSMLRGLVSSNGVGGILQVARVERA